MRSTMLGIAAVMVAASPVMADGLPVAPYTAGPTYQREVHRYERSIGPFHLPLRWLLAWLKRRWSVKRLLFGGQS